jgi:DNA modification methylase
MIKVKLFQYHVLEALKQIPDNSVDCIITSPPYWGLRKYPDQANIVWDGDSNCEHEFQLEEQKDPMDTCGSGQHEDINKTIVGGKFWEMKPFKSGFCKKCGAWFGQLGLEPNLKLYIKHLLQITAELKRILKPTGVMFWNHGGSYAGSMGNHKGWSYVSGLGNKKDGTAIYFEGKSNLPPKCETLQNFRLVLKMIDEQGWILRNTICWFKPNHLPESCKDRFSRSYEPIFMLVKNKRYYFNLDAVREPLKIFTEQKISIEKLFRFWGASKDGNCEYKKTKEVPLGQSPSEIKKNILNSFKNKLRKHDIAVGRIGNFSYTDSLHEVPYSLLGKNPGDVWVICTEPFKGKHFAVFPTSLVRRCIRAACPENGIVLDPFAGSGTTIKVAIEERRNCIGIDIVPEYINMIINRCNLKDNPLIDFELIV